MTPGGTGVLPLQGPLAVAGAGNMAEALVGGWVQRGVFRAEDIRVSDAQPDRSRRLAERWGARAANGNADAAAGARICLIAVKPQHVAAVLKDLREVPDAERWILSIAAGVTTRAIERGLEGTPRVVRAMPNTPALVGKGMSVISGGAHATEADLAMAETMLSAVGAVLRAEEADMDAVTAVSGSGPAYVFYLAEMLEEAARSLGLPSDTARELVARTIEGAAAMMRQTGDAPDQLRHRVTSPGGTTEAALRHLDAQHMREIWTEAVRRAHARAVEIARASESNA
ncbi:MAG: pyrroline-5-carboxylate reductase [Kiritimatiellae bacterium]|nr:pyrroline-5-carboxylate reductase [Kiritimatiellia bacterium]